MRYERAIAFVVGILLIAGGVVLHQQLDRVGLFSVGSVMWSVALLCCLLPGSLCLEFSQEGRVTALPVLVVLIAGILWTAASSVLLLRHNRLVFAAIVGACAGLSSLIVERFNRSPRKKGAAADRENGTRPDYGEDGKPGPGPGSGGSARGS
jgi:hypothetical protein